MLTLRTAGESDLENLYTFLNSPLREKLLAEPLPPREDFFQQTTLNLADCSEHYSLLEKDSILAGVIRILVNEESCEIWGRDLRTLFYHCGRIAFEELRMKRLQWYVRKNNRKMIHTCTLYRIRKTGEAPFFYIGRSLEFVAVGELDYYEFRPEEYRERIQLMQSNSLPISNIPRDLTEKK